MSSPRMSLDQYGAWLRKQTGSQKQAVKIDKPKSGRKKSSVEREYENLFLVGKKYKYEGITLHLENGLRYTCDFFVFRKQDIPMVIETKGAHKLPSEGRSRMAFLQAKLEYPCFSFHWIVRGKDKVWRERT